MREKRNESVEIRTRQSRQVKRPAPVTAQAPKKKVKIDYKDMEVSEYYLAASKRYRFAKFLSFVLLVAFLAVNLLFFRDNITYNNLMYLLRDLDSGAAEITTEFASITYNEESGAVFDIFKGKLAYASSEGFRLYNSTGARELDQSRYMQTPAIAKSNKYSIVYDVGGHAYSIFTTMACVFEGTAEDVLEDVCVSDNGSFATLTRSNEAKYLVSVYKENLKLQTKYYKDKYVVDITMDEKGKNLAIVSADVSVSGISSEIMLSKTGTEETASVTIEDAMPLAAQYMENGSLLVLCDTKLVKVADGKTDSEYNFGAGDIKEFRFGEDSVAVVLSDNAVSSENKVFLFDSDGALLLSGEVSGKVSRVCSDKSAVYVLTDSSIVRLTVDGEEKSVPCSAAVEDIVAVYGTLLKCEKLGTETVSFE